MENTGPGMIKLGTSNFCTPHGNNYDADSTELNYNEEKLKEENEQKD